MQMNSKENRAKMNDIIEFYQLYYEKIIENIY